MSKITTDLEAGEKWVGVARPRFQEILQYWGYTGDMGGGNVRAFLNSLLDGTAIGTIGPSEIAGTFLPKINFLNDPEQVILTTLFGDDEEGAWFDPDPATTFTDTAGTTPAQAGDAVARIDDLSGNGNHATQPTAAAQPILARVPASGRRNLLERTEEFDNPIWDKINSTVEHQGDGVYKFSDIDFGSETRHRMIYDGGAINEEQRTATVDVKAGTISTILFMQSRTGNASVGSNTTTFDIAAGEFIQSGSPFTTAVELLPDGWYRISIVRDDNFDSQQTWSIALGSDAYIGDGTGFVLLRKPQLEKGLVPTPYQRVGSTYDVTEAGQPDNFYLSFDGVDDFLSIASFDPAFDKVQVFAGVRKLSDANRASILTGPDLSSLTLSLEAPRFSDDYGLTNIMTAAQRANVAAPAPDTSILTAIGDFDTPTLANLLTQLRRNGVIAETSTGSLGATAGNYKAGVYTIGCREGASQFLNGQVYSLAMRFGPNLDLPTIERTEKYVANRTAGVSL